MRVFAMLSIGFAVLALLRRRSAAARHWVLAVTIACAAALPALQSIAPSWQIPERLSSAGTREDPAVSTTIAVSLPREPQARSASAAPARPSGPAAIPVFQWLARIQTAGALAGVLLLLVGLLRLQWIAARARPVTHGRLARIWRETLAALEISRPVRLLETDHTPLLMTWGVIRPIVVLPRGANHWTDARVRAVLVHELAHVRRGDWLMLMIAELLRAVDWINPLTWLAARRLRTESELACDDVVLSTGVPAHEYAGDLLALVRLARLHHGHAALAASAMARPSGIERRVEAMLNAGLDRFPATRLSRALVAAPLLAAALLVSGYGLSAQTLTSLSGTVFDPQNLGVPRATVSLADPRTETRHEVRSDATGRFEFVGLTPGDYRLEVKVPGFKSVDRMLSVMGRHVDQDVMLALGSLSESITLAYAPDEVVAQKPATVRAAVPGKPAACEASASGGNIRPPMKVRDVRPVYPVSGDTAEEGNVLIDARIGTDGTVVSAVPREPVSSKLAEAAVDAVNQWRFTPTLLNCVPVEVAMTVNVKFEKR
jgi:beta-lactamase regulating signal transducer with metallopeptidase domain